MKRARFFSVVSMAMLLFDIFSLPMPLFSGELAPIIKPDELRTELSSANPPLLIDVRDSDEYKLDHLPGAIVFPVDSITAATAKECIPSLDTPIVVYCRSGARSKKAAEMLVSLGYSRVRDFGGIGNWPFGTLGEFEP